MGTSQNIGNLNVTVSGDSTSLIASFNQAMDKIDEFAERSIAKIGNIDAHVERMGLSVLVGAHGIQKLHAEIVRVIENIDSIPGIPANTLETIHDMKYALDESNQSLSRGVATFASWIGKGAMGAGLLFGNFLYGSDAARDGLQKLNTEAEIFAKYSFDPKAVAAAEKTLALAKQSYDLIGAGKADSINKLVDASGQKNSEAAALPTHNGQKSVEAIRLEAEAQQLMNRAMTERLSLEGELSKLNEKLSSTEAQMYGASIPKNERLNALTEREWQLKGEIYDLEQRDPSPDRTAKLIDLKSKLLGIEEKEIPLLKAQQKIWDDMGKQFSDTIQNMITSGDSLKDTWHKLVKDMEADLVKSLIGDGLKNFFSGLAKGLFTGTGTGAGSLIGSAIFSMFSGHAGGGNMSGPSIVGENGPELFVPSGSGLVMNNDSTRAVARSSASAGNTYNIDARGADRSAIARLEATIKQVNGSIESRAIQANLTFNRRVTPSYNPAL